MWVYSLRKRSFRRKNIEANKQMTEWTAAVTLDSKHVPINNLRGLLYYFVIWEKIIHA